MASSSYQPKAIGVPRLLTTIDSVLHIKLYLIKLIVPVNSLFIKVRIYILHNYLFTII